MPLAYVAMADADADVAALWRQVWEEAGSSEAAGVRLYIADIAPLVLKGGWRILPYLQAGRQAGR
jgi:proteasome component ECM29